MSASTSLTCVELPSKLEAEFDLDREIAFLAGLGEFSSIEREPASAHAGHPADDFELHATLATISRAKDDAEALLARNQMLEAYVAEVERKARSEVKEAREAAETWTTRALDAETAVARLERALAESDARAAAAEEELQRGRQALILVHDAIAAAFGYGSALREQIRSADPNVPGLGLVRDKVVQLAIQIEAPEVRSQSRITHRAA